MYVEGFLIGMYDSLLCICDGVLLVVIVIFICYGVYDYNFFIIVSRFCVV